MANEWRMDIGVVITAQDSKSLGYVVSLLLTAKGDLVPRDSLPTHPTELFKFIWVICCHPACNNLCVCKVTHCDKEKNSSSILMLWDCSNRVAGYSVNSLSLVRSNTREVTFRNVTSNLKRKLIERGYKPSQLTNIIRSFLFEKRGEIMEGTVKVTKKIPVALPLKYSNICAGFK